MNTNISFLQSAPGRSLFSGDFFVNNAIFGAIELPTLLICVFLMRMGRKKSQMITLFGGGIFTMLTVLLSSSILKPHNTINNHVRTPVCFYCPYRILSQLNLAMAIFAKMCIQGAFNILYIFTSELYPTVIRNSAVGKNELCS